MPRTKKTESVEISEQNHIEAPEEVIEEQPVQEVVVENHIEKVDEKIPAHVLDLMRLYPQYEKIWVTPKGFVHPEGASKYMLKGAKLYTNKFYTN